ncbi:MAG: DUF6950 family protein [Brevundimonas sp.]|uniref:DUF6950 family protein n=1 Tax=Brevundimonas sp. TaxID=1871086 RepID=UPI0039192F75
MIDDRIRRAAAAEACWKRFNGKSYDPGKRDCVKLATHALIKMGHGSGLMKGLRYSSEAQGYRLLRKAGFKNLIEAVDARGLPRIAPAMAMQGDLLAMPAGGDGPFGAALAVAMSDGIILGFSHDHGICSTWRANTFITAWRL